MNQTKSHIPHYIHGTKSSHAKSSKTTDTCTTSKLTRPKSTTYGLNGRKRSTEEEDQKEDRNSKNEQSEINRLKTITGKQKERIANLEASSGKENVLKDEIKTLGDRLQQTDEKMEYYEKQLLLCNIDPVSLESLDPSQETKGALLEIGNRTKVEVNKLKESIDEMNNKTKQVLIDLKTIGNELDNICPEDEMVPS
ncbi:putative leucine-rich repeat-containing protein DDB_G0290503 [Mytilus trossulus]|uniref:putative leucine-rich repeat-containing protein DDB_G0290503 n=1 Tax=Mytilus trossulus TaxID=6551 RepID=UPI0030066920